ncbi:MAG TPA: PilZ domain-containing protein [Bacteriovoracaceae bacterium]|nr:PilZ domain-containing protein [Bacteriovoracaceae bacterium]
MKHKPLIFSVLLILFLVEPLIKVLYFKASTDFDFSTIFTNLFSRNSPREIFDFWLVFPLAGIALIRIRKWSYYVFLSLMAYIVFSFLTYEKYTWPYNSDSPLAYHYAVVALSLVIFSIFLIPQIREPFFNRRLRWWESKARYKTSLGTKIVGPKTTFDTQIINISQTGAFIQDSPYLTIGEPLQMQFDKEGEAYDLPVIVMSKHKIGEVQGCGVQFKPRSMAQKFQILKLIQKLKSEKVR